MQTSPAIPGVLPVDVAFDPPSGRVAIAFAATHPTSGTSGSSCPTDPASLSVTKMKWSAPSSEAVPGIASLKPFPAKWLKQVTAVAFGDDGMLYMQQRFPLAIEWEGGELVLDEATTKYDSGEDIFELDGGGGIACASCHPEGGDDGRTWLFDTLGGRRTMSVRGGLLGSGPFHWDGSLATFGDLVSEVFVHRMGGGAASAAQVKALKRYLDSMTDPPRSPPTDPAAVARGATLFASDDVGCTSCHSGAAKSDYEKFDVGTGGAMKVPTLHDLAGRAPYMHDGCAETLADRFGPCGGKDHGDTSMLTKDQIADLVAYLGSL